MATDYKQQYEQLMANMSNLAERLHSMAKEREKASNEGDPRLLNDQALSMLRSGTALGFDRAAELIEEEINAAKGWAE